MNEKVKVWEEGILLPSYGIGQPEKNPMFFERRVYQGSSGVVYPYPVIEKIENTCEDKLYKAVFLENEYLKIMILPELGGRIQMAYDKVKQRHFIYYNHVIKPALVGLTGPWISGGIEFNWPQHHRPSTFLPVDYKLEKCPDGSAIVWVSERERMFHQKGMAGFKLLPGRAVLEVHGKVYNPTPVPQTFLWWANPAVAVNEHYQSVFPGDVNAVFDHGKRDVSKYPIATGTYYKTDYSAGVDISCYKNIPVPTSYMAIQSNYDFVGGYENDTRAGVLHVANHHISPGKKQWTWGNGDFGQAWDRNLTDTDGPYIELMTGVYTDNQPDFTWLQPYEEKTFIQYFLPYRELGIVKNASADLLMNIEPFDSGSILKVFATSKQEQVGIEVKKSDTICFQTIADIIPESIFEAIIPINSLEDIEVCIFSATCELLLSWKPEAEEIKPVPDPARPALDPADVTSVEQLYLTGLHLEQYRHATYNSTDYYKEAIRREPGDVRSNNAMGLWLIRKGQFAQAEVYLRKSIETLTERNPNPYDGEPFYNLGLSLKYQGKYQEAYNSFYKSCWNAAWQDAGYYSLAQLSCIKQDWEAALFEVEKSLIRNWHNHGARHLKATILRHLNRKSEALILIDDSLGIDGFNFGCLFEKYLLTGETGVLEELHRLMRRESHNYLELVIDYIASGCWEEALLLLEQAIGSIAEPEIILYYFKGFCQERSGNKQGAKETIILAETKTPGCCFPNQLEAIEALQTAINLVEHSPKASYLLGNLWYDKRQYKEAVGCWERSLKQDNNSPVVMRNLSLAYYNKMNKKDAALNLLEKAFALDTTDARILMELDQLYKRFNRSASDRFTFLEKNKDTVWMRDDLYLEYITLLNQLGRYEKAINLINSRNFHPWEGGEGKVPAQYQIARVELAKKYVVEKQYEQALLLIDECYIYPHNLGEGKLQGAQENDFDYYKGCILQAMGKEQEAVHYFEKASTGICEPAAAMYYNDQKSEKIFFQGLALLKLGRDDEAKGRFNKLITYGEKHLFEEFKIDYFAVSLPDMQIWEDDMDHKKKNYCYYLMALGHLGIGNKDKSELYFRKSGLTLTR